MSSFITYEIIDLVGINMEKIIRTYILLGSFWLNLAQSVKRSHDRGNSGWFIIIPFYTIWLFLQKVSQIQTGMDLILKINNYYYIESLKSANAK
jgi:uncharacterized membrane protein YhaH (DUF805 family)